MSWSCYFKVVLITLCVVSLIFTSVQVLQTNQMPMNARLHTLLNTNFTLSLNQTTFNTTRHIGWHNCTPLTKQNTSKKPLILYYSSFWGNQWGNLQHVFYAHVDAKGKGQTHKPLCYDCESTTNRSRLHEATVVVFHLPDLHHKLPTKYCGQYFALVNLEAPTLYDSQYPKLSLTKQSNQRFFRSFDISVDYRLDADVPIPYFLFRYEQGLENAIRKPIRIPIAKRYSDFPVAWVASKCKTHNERYSYVKELMKHIGVKSYGKCLHNADIPKGNSYEQEAEDAISKHKFYLSFENSNCDYYVTEKLTRALEYGVIPVIMGSPNISHYLPNNHSGIIVADFKSPKELAKRLHEINNNDTLFMEYMRFKLSPKHIDQQFRERWFENHRHRACRLCDIATKRTPLEELKGVKLDTSCKKPKKQYWQSK